ncbi:MAG TPA: hypothetical protein VJ736_06695 [Actinomycetota bacterium]|nr:hypothetical protein [Actinomycetota bacterium]
MSYFTDLMDGCDAAVRDRLGEQERVITIGRCADVTTTGDLDSAGAGWTYVMVTDRRVHWVPHITNATDVCSLDLDRVRTCTELHRRHRSALLMDHEPLVRLHFPPNGRPPNTTYTHGDPVLGSLSQTILGFSRPTAAAAEALKDQLARRGLEIPQVERADRLP